MLRLAFWLLRWALALALLGFTAALLRVAIAPLVAAEGWKALAAPAAAWGLPAGVGFRWLLSLGRRGDPLELIDTLEHELTHAVTGWLTFAPPVSLKATLRGGGEVELKRSNPVAALSPYCLPLYAALLAPLTFVLLPEWAEYARLVVALLLGSFIWRLFREFHFGQSDLQEFGAFYSLVFIAGGLPVCLSAILDISGLADVRWAAAADVYLEWANTLPDTLRKAARPW